MVTYLPSSNTTTITVLTAEIGTKLSISAPANVIQGQSFEIFGVLQRLDTNEALNGETIELWVDGVFIDSMLTDWVGTPVGPQSGAYQFFYSLADTGVHTLEVKFLGSERAGLILSPSVAKTTVSMPGIPEITPLVGAIAIGVVLLGGYMIAKRW